MVPTLSIIGIAAALVIGGTVVSLFLHTRCLSEARRSRRVRRVVTPWNWTPGKVKARRYTRTKKGVHDDTTTNLYSRIQNAGGA